MTYPSEISFDERDGGTIVAERTPPTSYSDDAWRDTVSILYHGDSNTNPTAARLTELCRLARFAFEAADLTIADNDLTALECTPA